ncbi:uncharacterized protein [Littorina saxatilis]|uniref:uncharacterized protein n=1 Tax=Littorina saxatilis TaxID=31220 RepID=UPI0038B60F6C
MKPVFQHDALHVTHVIHHVECDDMGSVTCEIEEAGVNESIPLLVKCPPKFNGNYKLEEDDHSKSFVFPFRSHTVNITDITLSAMSSGKLEPGHHSHTYKSSNFWRVFGIAPDLELKIKMTEDMVDVGDLWQLKLFNDNGSDVIEFTIPGNGTTHSSTIPPPVAAIAVGISTAIVLVVLITCVIIRKGRHPQQHIYQNSPAQAQPNLDRPLQYNPLALRGAAIAMHDLQDRQSRRSDETHSSNTYEEVDDLTSSSETDVSDSRQDSRVDDFYLHPVSSTADLREVTADPTSLQSADDSCKDACARSSNTAGTENAVSSVVPHDDDVSILPHSPCSIKQGQVEDPFYTNTHL